MATPGPTGSERKRTQLRGSDSPDPRRRECADSAPPMLADARSAHTEVTPRWMPPVDLHGIRSTVSDTTAIRAPTTKRPLTATGKRDRTGRSRPSRVAAAKQPGKAAASRHRACVQRCAAIEAEALRLLEQAQAAEASAADRLLQLTKRGGAIQDARREMKKAMNAVGKADKLLQRARQRSATQSIAVPNWCSTCGCTAGVDPSATPRRCARCTYAQQHDPKWDSLKGGWHPGRRKTCGARPGESCCECQQMASAAASADVATAAAARAADREWQSAKRSAAWPKQPQPAREEECSIM